jgi:hypothetical protein
VWFALVASIACRAPFGADRHDLIGDRIAAVELVGATPRVAIVSDGRLWSDVAPELAWGFVPLGDDDAAAAFVADDAVALGVGPALDVPADGGRLVGLATWPSGEEERFFLDVPAGGPPPLPAFEVTVEALPLDLATLTAADMTVDARAGLVPTDDALVAGGVARITAVMASEVDATARFMSAGGAGTWFELDPWVADWVAGDLVLDDEDVVTAEPLAEPAVVGGLVLVLDGAGATRWRSRDWWVGTPEDGVWVAGRFVPSDVALEAGPVDVVLAPDPAASPGVRVVAVATEAAADLPCAGAAGFDPEWLLDGRCVVADVVDVPVTIEVSP